MNRLASESEHNATHFTFVTSVPVSFVCILTTDCGRPVLDLWAAGCKHQATSDLSRSGPNFFYKDAVFLFWKLIDLELGGCKRTDEKVGLQQLPRDLY